MKELETLVMGIEEVWEELHLEKQTRSRACLVQHFPLPKLNLELQSSSGLARCH